MTNQTDYPEIYCIVCKKMVRAVNVSASIEFGGWYCGHHTEDELQKAIRDINEQLDQEYGESPVTRGTRSICAVEWANDRIAKIFGLPVTYINRTEIDPKIVVGDWSIYAGRLCPEHKKPINPTGIYYECGCPV